LGRGGEWLGAEVKIVMERKKGDGANVIGKAM
jgi:hypothetical protein